MSTEYGDLLDDPGWMSDCCGERGFQGLQPGEMDDAENETMIGICSKCKDHTGFHRTTEDF
jgi:hypothetical protein